LIDVEKFYAKGVITMPLESLVKQTDLSLETIVLFVSDMMASRSFYEHTLGLRALTVNPHVAMYSAGHVQICLLPAAAHGVTLQDGRDRSANITIMVDNVPRCRDALEARGVRFSRTLEYIIGMTADFYDPDGHWFSLFQPSEVALGWPSGRKLEAFAAGLPNFRSDELADAFVAYVFLFFSDADVAADFYGDVLGLEAIEGGPCRRIPTSVDIGVVKYDVGTTMLATHHVELDDKRFRVSTLGTDGVAIVFQVADLERTVAALSRRGIAFSGPPSESPIGHLARFTDPAGHVLLLREPTQDGEQSVVASMSATPAAEN
jgi:catechol 2,3-dioxygenase-like lactoylglutathione lyase family enzyme